MPALEQYTLNSVAETDGEDSSYGGSGTYEVLWSREDDTVVATPLPDFKPIASAEDNGEVKFFGRVKVGRC